MTTTTHRPDDGVRTAISLFFLSAGTFARCPDGAGVGGPRRLGVSAV